jgi:hypothetical protein
MTFTKASGYWLLAAGCMELKFSLYSESSQPLTASRQTLFNSIFPIQ